MLATLAFLFAAITNSYAAGLTLDKIDGVPYVSGMNVDLLSVKIITGTVTAGNTNVQLDLLDATGNVLRNAFVSRNFYSAGTIDMDASGIPGVTTSLSTLGANFANGLYVIRARIMDCSVMDMVTFSCLETVQTFPVTQNRSGQTSTPSLTGMWWNQNESGWGMSLTQRGSMIFVAWYTYDPTGKPAWYVMSSCPVVGSGCTGDIYDVMGGTPLGVPWNGSGKIVSKVGTGTLMFADNNTGTFNYSVNGVSGTKNIARQIFATGSSQPTIDYSALWWNANESGWGIALTQQYGTIFATMYTYDAGGNPVWYVASNCAVSGAGCSGDLYQVAGGSAPTVTWNGTNKVVTKVGTVSFAFSDSSDGTMNYTINGVSGSKSISKQLF